VRVRNWAGNVTFTAERVDLPTSIDQLQNLIAGAERVRVLGSGHSFTTIADSARLISLRKLPDEVQLDSTARTASCPAGLTYAELASDLEARGFALPNLGSLPQISVGGSIATATHGSGDRNGNLATAVAGIEIATSSGDLITALRGAPDFNGLVVGLGAAGAVTRVILDVEPSFAVTQQVYEGLSWESLETHFDALTAAGHSVSVFTRWGETAGSVWIKRRVSEAVEPMPDDVYGAQAASGERHPIPGGDVAASTPQLGVPGPWFERLPHFRPDFTPSAGAELQSEYFVARTHAGAALDAIRDLAPLITPLLQISEIRTVARDTLWLSPQYEQATVAIHFTWQLDEAKVLRAVAAIEDALAPFAPRPHWGKVFAIDATTIAARYERLPDFTRLIARLDPRAAFRNEWLETRVLGRPSL
jgi:xylitol oxidase